MSSTGIESTISVIRESLQPMLEKQSAQLMSQYDKNGDGVVEFAEVLSCVPGFSKMAKVQQDVVRENLRVEFDKWDINKDGKVEKHEFAKFVENTTIALIRGQIEQVEQQMKMQLVATFAQFDKNSDGFLHREEFEELHKFEVERAADDATKAIGEQIMNFEEMDENHDEQVSFDEYWNRSYRIYQASIVKTIKA